MYGYGLIGNCQISALISERGSIDWLCLPRPDSDPVFGRMLDPAGGHFSIELAGGGDDRSPSCSQSYLENTNILVTEQRRAGVAIRITDFCPRFYQFGRNYRPLMLLRIVEPIAGSPLASCECRPVSGWDKKPLAAERGSSHFRYRARDSVLRLTTNMPLTYLESGQPFALEAKIYLGLTWGVGIEDDLARVAEDFLAQTAQYWRTWVKHCSIPTLHQRETIRSALALKLHCYEDTGAIVASPATSMPEEIGKQRNWDYRYCWLRDAYFALTAFHNLGHFEEMEAFLKFLLNIALAADGTRQRLAPVYSVSGAPPLPERTHDGWSGFAESRPVRSNNQAAEHVQHDVYGEMILTFAPIFLDERFLGLRTKEHEGLIANLAASCAEFIGKADAGIWEIRDRWQEHSFSNLMCWAGLDRAAAIRARGFLPELTLDLEAERTRAEAAVRGAARNGSIRNGPKDESCDASLALVKLLRFPDANLARGTLDKIRSDLAAGARGEPPGFLYRYRRADDFGTPASAFIACSFWEIQGLALAGSQEPAAEMMSTVLRSANHLGLYSEHFLPGETRQLGNFPQAYSHVGQINAAFALSPPWHEVL
ncbi:MAG: glycoside hydrolase family 15 protein [Planctomycetes bacterium]|nr:glycoside hydrolase family 15 protein [Planctomycetota bacterium]